MVKQKNKKKTTAKKVATKNKVVKKKAAPKKGKKKPQQLVLGVFEGEDGQFYWQAKRGWHIVAIGGEGFSTRSNARKSARSFIASVQHVKTNTEGQVQVLNIDI